MTNLSKNQARIIFNNQSSIGVYVVYQGDGYYAKEVWTSRVYDDCVKYCCEHNLEIVR